MKEPSIEDIVAQAKSSLRNGKAIAAEAALRSILEKQPDNFDALRLLGVSCYQQGKHNDATEFFQKALEANPKSSDTLLNLGVVKNDLKEYEKAIRHFRQSLELDENNADAFYALGGALASLDQHQEAIDCFRHVIAIEPKHFEAHNNLGVALRKLKQDKEAMESIRQALELKPDFAEAYANLGGILVELNHHQEGVKCLALALDIKPGLAGAHNNMGAALNHLKRYQEAIASFRRALDIDPLHANAYSQWVYVSQKICDWSRFSETRREIKEQIRQARPSINPLHLMSWFDDPQLQLQCARHFSGHKVASGIESVVRKVSYPDDRIRIAYVSGTFRRHATANHTAELFELHNRERFEVIGISYGPDDNSPIRRRLEKAFDDFVDVRTMSDHAVAEMIAKREIHITIDLMGYTTGCRPGIHARRPAPIHANYLGFPGTMGADFVDYIVADPFVTPLDQQPFYTEKLVHLPDCYWVTDSRLEIAGETPSRTEAGLPETGFVFCCFNSAFKITPPIFDIWMRLLKAVPESVIWLLGGDETLQKNLRLEATARGVDPERLIFAGHVDLADHLARHRLADLFLDTLPFNAHTVAGDALWVGLPVLTCTGRSFASRVAGSMLQALDLPELVTGSLEDYEALALKLASDHVLMKSIRAKLDRNKTSARFFDCARFRKHMEKAYETMIEIWRAGDAPRSIAVEPRSP
ncbi:MAG: tetratricopeptide repeat protein [Alphaproteobacteria bacterium]